MKFKNSIIQLSPIFEKVLKLQYNYYRKDKEKQMDKLQNKPESEYYLYAY